MAFQSRKTLATLLVLAAFGSAANAQVKVAVFGNNGVDDFINTLAGFQAVLVSDGDLSTANFLTANNFSAVFYTRDGSSFGTSLSATAAANVAAFVGATGNVVLLNGDFSDGVPSDANINLLIENAVNFATASGNGYIGEFAGAIAALTTNGSGLTSLNLIPGTAGANGGSGGGSDTSLALGPGGASSAVLAGVTLNNPGSVEFGADITGVAPANVHAVWSGGSQSPAVIVRGRVGAVGAPEPATLALLAIGGVGFLARRKRAA